MSFKDGKLYKVEKLNKSHPYWYDIVNIINNKTNINISYYIEELYSISWKHKPFKWSWAQEFKPNRRFFFCGISKSNIENILDYGFQSNIDIFRDGIYLTYHSNKAIDDSPEGYILSNMVYVPKSYVVNPYEEFNENEIDFIKNNFHSIEFRTNSIIQNLEVKNHTICIFNSNRVIPRFIIKVKKDNNLSDLKLLDNN